jgi:hypothetical protein
MRIVVMITIFEASQALIKKQQPEVIGFGVTSFTDQNSGLDGQASIPSTWRQ